MQTTQFIWQHGYSKELEQFAHIKEFSFRKNNTIQLDSFVRTRNENLHIYCVVDGKFEWAINDENRVMYPGDAALVLPDQEIGGVNGYLEIGTIFHLELLVENMAPTSHMILGKWSGLSSGECQTIGKIFLHNNLPVVKTSQVACLLREMHSEMMSQEIGYVTKTNHLLDTLLIIIARQCTKQSSSRRDFPQVFMKLEQTLRASLAHQWTVEEMAAIVALGTTAFTEKVKNHTGFPPLHYLINIRISEAIKLLKQEDFNITEIALKTGFYSSQHFSTTFKKLTGHTPKEFRKRNTGSTT